MRAPTFLSTQTRKTRMLGVLPREIAKKVLPVTITLVEADADITALVLAMVKAMEALLAEGQTSWRWADAEHVHMASKDPARTQPWAQVTQGQYVKALEAQWEELDSDVLDYLHSPGSGSEDSPRETRDNSDGEPHTPSG
jgi:hypothetical protein